MNIHVNHSSRTAIYLQIATQMKAQILSGEIAAGSSLPSERAMAQRLGVHRNTVIKAYAELKAEELIVSNLEQNHPEAFATLTANQQQYKTLPRYINNNTPLPVQEAMFTKELANAFIAIRTHMPEAEAKVSHVSFLNRNFNPMHPENVTEYHPAVREKVYEAALNAHNVAETTTAIVLGKRIKMAVEAEKAQAPTITKEQVKEAARKVAVKAAEAVLEAAAEKHPAAAAVNAAVKKTRTRSKAASKAKEKDQGLEL